MKRIIIVFLFILSGCTPEKKNPESQKEPQAENVNIECIYEIQTPYIDIWSPKVIEPMIYMGASDRSKNSDIIDTVSYTHLDVYKRQIFSIVRSSLINLAKLSDFAYLETIYKLFTRYSSI